MDELEYITQGALTMCDKGAAPVFFNPTTNTTVKIHGCLVATKNDFVPLANIPTFMICTLTQKPCVPQTKTWEKTWSVKVKGHETLIGQSICRCNTGGTIEFMTSGQIPLPDDAKQEVEDLQKQAKTKLDKSGNKNRVGETGFAEGMIPVWGSGRDMINAIQTGNGWGVAMNAGFLIWDVASIAVGVLTLGGGTAAMQAGKAGLKGAMKAGGKKISKKAMQGLGKAGFNKLSKETLSKSIADVAKKLMCVAVKACFTGDTLVHTEKGLVKIKDIKVGDNVFSYDSEQDTIVLNKVTNFFENDVHEILEIITESETIKTTRSHPFFVNGEFKDAEQINIGDDLFSKEMRNIKVVSLNYLLEATKVYNFEVENSHCYFIGEEGVWVLNKCYHRVFFKEYPHLKGKVVVHHAVEQQMLKKYPKLFTKVEIHSLDNLRGIPKELNNTLHLSKIRMYWDNFYSKFPNSTKQQILDYAKFIDKEVGHLFIPPL